MPDAKFYVYFWLRENGTPYYVGKGKLRRAMRSGGHRVYRPAQDDRIILQDYSSNEEASEAEIFFISYFGRLDIQTGCLRNRTAGGEGALGRTGMRQSANFKKLISTLNRQRVWSPDSISRLKRAATKRTRGIGGRFVKAG